MLACCCVPKATSQNGSQVYLNGRECFALPLVVPTNTAVPVGTIGSKGIENWKATEPRNSFSWARPRQPGTLGEGEIYPCKPEIDDLCVLAGDTGGHNIVELCWPTGGYQNEHNPELLHSG